MFSFFLWWRMVERKTSFSHVFSSEQSLSSLKYKCDIVFSVILSLDQSSIKPEKRYTFNNKLLKILKKYYVTDLSTRKKT